MTKTPQKRLGDGSANLRAPTDLRLHIARQPIHPISSTRRPHRPARTSTWLGVMLVAVVALVLPACRPKACAPCKDDSDCGSGMTCARQCWGALPCLSTVSGRVCKSSEKIAADVPQCAGDCINHYTCRDYGDCSLVGEQCVATSAVDCRASVECKRNGKCTLIGDECVPGSAADCKQSDGCRETGHCAFTPRNNNPKDNMCLVGGPADCRQSAECKKLRKCRPSADHWRCE